MTSTCPHCILYIYDTLQHSLPVNHPNKAYICLDKIPPSHMRMMATSMETILHLYKGHHNLAARLLRESRATKAPSLGDATSMRIFDKILMWYKYMEFGKKQEIHPLAREIEFLAVEAVSCGYIQTRQKEDPLEVFKKWYLDCYLSMIEQLETIHKEHTLTIAAIQSTTHTNIDTILEEWNDLYT